MEIKIVKALKIRSDLYIEAEETVCFTLADGTEWDGKLIDFNDSEITVFVDGAERLYKYEQLTSLWKWYKVKHLQSDLCI